MADNLQQMFETMTNQLKKVKRAIEQQFNDFSTAFQQKGFLQCCKINGTFNPKFRTQVRMNRRISKLYLIYEKQTKSTK